MECIPLITIILKQLVLWLLLEYPADVDALTNAVEGWDYLILQKAAPRAQATLNANDTC